MNLEGLLENIQLQGKKTKENWRFEKKIHFLMKKDAITSQVKLL